MKTIKVLALATLLPMLAASCTDENYKVYDTTQKDAVFFEYRNAKNQIDSVINYTFGYDIANVHTIEIPVHLMGMPTDRTRQIKVETLEGSTMVEGKHYTVAKSELKGGAINDTVKIDLLRDKDPELLQKSFSLRITIGENDDLRNVGSNVITINYDDIRPSKRPEWWGAWDALPEWSFENTQLFFDYFYRLAPKANKEVFDEIIKAYGDYFVKGQAKKGPITMYGAFIRNYVCIPLADEHPEIQWQSDPHW